MRLHDSPYTKSWKKDFIKALQCKSFQYTPPNNKQIPLPDPPEPGSNGKIPKYRIKSYLSKVKEINKLNALQDFIHQAYKEHYHGNK